MVLLFWWIFSSVLHSASLLQNNAFGSKYLLLATLGNLNSFIWALDTCFLDWMVSFDSKHFSSPFPKQVRIKPVGPAGSGEELAVSPASDWSRSSSHRAGRRERERESLLHFLVLGSLCFYFSNICGICHVVYIYNGVFITQLYKRMKWCHLQQIDGPGDNRTKWSKSGEGKYHMTSLVCGIWKKDTNELI